MVKKNPNNRLVDLDDLDVDGPAFVRGQRYMFMAPGGFTLFGVYVKALGLGAHRFACVAHLLNAGGKLLPALCAEGPGPDTKFTPGFPRPWNGTPIQWTEWVAGPFPWEAA